MNNSGDRRSSGLERAVVITVAPPRTRRSTMASPIPFVPPVTRIRFPLNSFPSNVAFGFSFIEHTITSHCRQATPAYRPRGNGPSRSTPNFLYIYRGREATSPNRAFRWQLFASAALTKGGTEITSQAVLQNPTDAHS